MTQQHHALIVGVGSIGERHLRCFQSTGRAQVSIIEIDAALRARIAGQYGVASFGSIDEALAAGGNAGSAPDLAVIATPAHTHVKLATQVATAKRHVLIEKPLATSLLDVERLAKIAADKRLTVGVAYVYRLFPPLAAMREAVLRGRFGRPLELVAVAGQHFPTYRPAYRDTYYADRATGGGAIQDALTHLLNAGEWLVGRIDRVVSDAAHQVLDGVEVEDTAHVLARHGDVLASYSLNQHQAPNEMCLTVVCERGTLRWEAHHHRWRWTTRPDEPWHDEAHEPLPRDAVFVAQANHFLDAIEGRAPLPCSLAEGLQTLRVNLAALTSLDSQTWQSVESEP